MLPYSKEIQKPWGKEVIITDPGQKRVGKIIYVNANSKLSLQYHDQKEETLCLFSGKALIWLQAEGEDIEKTPMEKNKGYFIAPGKKHRIEAIDDSIIFEVSSPEAGTTFRIEDDYNRNSETEENRKQVRGN